MSKIIGLDPGVNFGLAIIFDGVLRELHAVDFWTAIGMLVEHDDAFVVTELPATKHIWHTQAKTRGAIGRTGMNVGSVIREAELIRDWLQRNHRRYIAMQPQGKCTAEFFERVTGWKGRSNQHTRDAAMLALGQVGKIL